MTNDASKISQRTLRILHLEDNLQDREWVAAVLEESEIKSDIIYADSREAFEEVLGDEDTDLIISDYSMPGYNGIKALRFTREKYESVPFIFFSGTMGEEVAIESLKNGAADYVLKQNPDRLVAAVRRALAAAEDRVSRRHMEEELRQRDTLLRQIMNNVEDLIALVDLEGRRMLSSPSHAKVLGVHEPQAGTDFFKEIHPEDRDSVRAAFSQISATGISATVECRLMTVDGCLRHMEAKGSVILDEGRRANCLLWVFHDMTERKIAEEKIREQAALLDEARDAICVNDLDQNVLFWNKSAERLYGWTASEAIGRNANELLLQRNVALAAMKMLIGRGEWHGELHQTNRSGNQLIVESRWTLIRDSGGAPKSILVINTDVTEKKVMEAQFLRTQRMENLGALAGGIAHDLNNILAPIMMAAGVIGDDIESEMCEGLLETIISSAKRGSELVNQILSFTRGTTSEIVPISLKRIVKEVVKLTERTFPRSISIHMAIPPDLPDILGDATRLHQVLLNLCVNARDAMPGGGALTIEATPVQLNDKRTAMGTSPFSGPFVELKVTDTGSGIPIELQSKIFEPFFTTKEPGKGTGIGLSTVIGIMKSYGGFIEVSSEPARGTTFHVYFPIAAGTAQPTNEGDPTEHAPGKGEQILVVEDEIALLEITGVTLSAYNYRLLTATNGPEAMELFTQHHATIDLVLADMMIPGMDGNTFLNALREIKPDVRVVAVSGMVSHKLENSPRHNVEAFLNKPYTTTKLLATLRSVLD